MPWVIQSPNYSQLQLNLAKSQLQKIKGGGKTIIYWRAFTEIHQSEFPP